MQVMYKALKVLPIQQFSGMSGQTPSLNLPTVSLIQRLEPFIVDLSLVISVNYPHFSSSKCGLPASMTDAFPPCGLLVLLRLGTARTGFPPSIFNILMPSALMFNAELPSRS